MLDPYDRMHLMEILRPPEGYSLDFAIGTTFSLDLLALMTAPVAFTLFDAGNNSGRPDILALLESLRRYAGRICILCHAGRIRIPEPKDYDHPLYSFLEGSVFQALPRSEDGSFHPKVWALRYTSQDGPVTYRFLCLSRNLTYDRSWDTALVFDGILKDRENAIASNHPLGDFIASLPGMVAQGLPEEMQNRIDQVQHEIRRVAFIPPQGFESAIFHPLGIDNKETNPLSGRIDRMLVVSPFLAESCLNRLASLGKDCALVSRLDSLQKISADCLRNFSEILCLKDNAIPEPDEFANPGLDENHIDLKQVAIEDKFDGLHAKLYVADAGSEGRIWTGSANATDAAFSKNIEFLVELRGKKKNCGVDAVLNGGKEKEDGKQAGLRILLDPVSISDGPVVDDNEPLKNLAKKTRNALAKAGLSARVSLDANEHFAILIEGEISSIPEEASIMVRPITLPRSRAMHLSVVPEVHAEFKQLSDLEISAFFAFDLTVRSGSKRLEEGFVLKLHLEGAPEDRNERILRAILKDKSQVIRLMLLLLSLEKGSELSGINGGTGLGEVWKWRPGTPPGIMPLFECMVRALNRDPQRIDDLNNLIKDLRGNPETQDLLPEGLDEIWKPIWEARKMIGGKPFEKA